jgi:hypothetical protein
LEVLASRAGGFLNRLVNDMAWNILALGFLDKDRWPDPGTSRKTKLQLIAVFRLHMAGYNRTKLTKADSKSSSSLADHSQR